MTPGPLLLPRPRHVGPVGSVGDGALPPQGYRLVVGDGGDVHIDAADDAGRFYAERTLDQLGDAPAPIAIEDWPDVLVRGVMLDVSRDKVPTMATLFALVDRLAGLKINHLQLYVEHTFAYAGHDDVWRDASPFTPDEIRSLDAYCAARHVELAANQNCLGHMERWLRFDRYRPLAIRPDGWTDRRGRHRDPMTLDPSKPGAIELVRDLLGQLLANVSSPRVHVGLDEPWELPDERFDDYLDYVRRLRSVPELDGRDMLMWGDVVASHPERVAELPAGVTVCEWGYEAPHPFDARAAALAATGLPFWLCPGTSSWNTLGGRWTNMRENVERAATAAITHGAEGVLVTDWGDNGHLQYLPVSEPGFAWAAATSWCVDANRNLDLDRVVSVHLFGDDTGEIGAVLRELGDAHLALTPQVPNMSVLALPLYVPSVRMGEGFTEGVTDDELVEAKARIAAAVAHVGRASPSREDGYLVLDELRATAELLDLLVDDARARLAAGGAIDDVDQRTGADLVARLDPMVDRHRELWLARNRPGGLDDSAARITRLSSLWRQ
ncbi:MAG TPA: family 20 glycosylhydrolase [Acidimicrobiales bacterium]